MALIALFAPTARSTPTMAATGCQLQNVTAFRSISAFPRPVGSGRPPDSILRRVRGRRHRHAGGKLSQDPASPRVEPFTAWRCQFVDCHVNALCSQ